MWLEHDPTMGPRGSGRWPFLLLCVITLHLVPPAVLCPAVPCCALSCSLRAQPQFYHTNLVLEIDFLRASAHIAMLCPVLQV